jgi:hypothetical protein
MVVSLGSVCTSRVGAWVVHDFSCVALSYLSFSNDARVFVTLLIRHAVSFSPVLSRPIFQVVTAQGVEGKHIATQAVSIGLELGFFSGTPVYWVGHVLLQQNVTTA